MGLFGWRPPRLLPPPLCPCQALKLKYGPFNATLVGVRAPLEAAGVQLVKTLDGSPGANLTQAYWDNVQSVFQSLWTVPDQLLDVWYDTPPEYPGE